MIDLDKLKAALRQFHSGEPFPHVVIDEFVDQQTVLALEDEMLPYDSPKWFIYKNQVEDKKALNDWNVFGFLTYRYFDFLNSAAFIGPLAASTGTGLVADPGLHGGGWHIHGPGGNLNPHLDYSLHPKLGLQRKINVILYVASGLRPEHGGHLGFWEHDPATGRPGRLRQEIAPVAGRAVIFDTTQNSWHGMSRGLSQPAGTYRKSLAAYFLCEPGNGVDSRARALFAPREEQRGDQAVEELIKARAGVASSAAVYRS